MSIRHMIAVWDYSQYTQTALLIHLALADFANDEGVSWPSIKSLAKRGRCSPRHVQSVLNQMVQDGLLTTEERTGRSNLYTLKMPQGGEPQFRGGVNPSSPRTFIEPPVEPSENESTSSPIPQGEGAKPLTEQQQWFQALCWLIGWDYKVLTKDQSGQVASTIKVLRKAGYTIQDMRDVWSKVWVNDWRYRKNKQRPTLTQLREAVGQLRATNSLYEEPQQGNHKVYVSLKTKERFECVTDNGGESWYWVKDGRKYPEGWVDLDQRMRDNADRWWDSERGEYKYDEWERWNEECRAAAVLHRYGGNGQGGRTGTTSRAAAAD